MRVCRIAVTLLSLVFIPAASARAGHLYLQGINDPNLTAEAVLTYAATTATDATLTIVLTNTSSAPVTEASLTGFGFNAPAEVSMLTLTAPVGWTGVFRRDDINSPGNFGYFDAAALTNASGNNPNINGGSVAAGLAIGETETFVFDVDGTGLLGLTADSFLSEFTLEHNHNSQLVTFLGRFQGVVPGTSGGSDVAIPIAPIPEPSTITLSIICLGIGGLIGLRRRRR